MLINAGLQRGFNLLSLGRGLSSAQDGATITATTDSHMCDDRWMLSVSTLHAALCPPVFAAVSTHAATVVEADVPSSRTLPTPIANDYKN